MRLLWLAAVAAFLLDQWSKFHVFGMFSREMVDRIEIAPPLLVFRKGMNTGINFGLFSDSSGAQPWLLIGLSVLLCTALWIWARRAFQLRIEFFSAGLIIGGAMGNVVDRLIFPGVRDFLNMSCCGIANPYVFNLADVFIFAGAIGLVIFGTEKKRSKKPS
ncbi:signal peptidase II [Aliiruegeria lutimaris]|uniref:Lipoprotein signal peptidase n=1 Tax=Aliiruegeria lutimaris TaxID=571298 RepID=A0A1G9CQQ0_9RHOB|nr:signal peptidase II [Aliiruegeria lutimaris]SDK53957.1 signal peptidase II Aspartic peptidase. MEROPS family A08 [Aliiruegeria lutimaris]